MGAAKIHTLQGSLFTIIIKPVQSVGRFRTSPPLLLLLLRLLLAAAKTNDSQLTGTYAPSSVGQFLAFYEEDRSGFTK